MTDFASFESARIAAAARALAADDKGAREPLWAALLAEPVAVAELGPGAPPGPNLRIGANGPQVRLLESLRLGAPVVALYASGTALAEGAAERGLWPDGVPRGVAFDAAAVFPLLRGHPGALVIAARDKAVPIDAGEVAALAEKLAPGDYLEGVRKLVASGRPREAARRLAGRPLYTLGHPQGGMLTFQRDLPVFLHLATAERFAEKVQKQTGARVHHGLVAAAELFKNAARGKMFVLVDPGPGSIRFRPDDLR